MSGVPFTARSTTVQVLAGIALVLFCLVFLRFVTLTFAHDATRHTAFITAFDGEALHDPEISEAKRAMDRAIHYFERVERETKRRRCGNDGRYERLRQAKEEVLRTKLRLRHLQQQRQHEAVVQQELNLRAMQNIEIDETLRNRLGLGEETVPILR